MIRNLKVLIAAAMALAAFGAIGAAGAQAAEFRCSVAPCTYTMLPDGAAGSAAAHHELVIKQGGATPPATCDTISGDATAGAAVVPELKFTAIKYTKCNLAGEIANLEMNGCEYLFKNTGTITIQCPVGKSIQLKVVATGCTISIGAQGPLGGITFKNHAGGKELITMEMKVANIAGTANNACGGNPKLKEGAVTVEYTTGNTLLTGETPGGVMANAWFE